MQNFNLWYAIAPLFVLLGGVLGFFQYKIGRKGQLKLRYEDGLIKLYTAVSTIIVTLMVLIESPLGLIQMLRECENGWPFWLNTAILGIFCIGGYIFALYFTAVYVCAVRYSVLQERAENKRRIVTRRL